MHWASNFKRVSEIEYNTKLREQIDKQDQSNVQDASINIVTVSFYYCV